MKKIIAVAFFFSAIIFFDSCKKDNTAPNPVTPTVPTTPTVPIVPPASQSTYFFENTEWTGVAATYGRTYSLPCYLRFNGDTTVSVYALFIFLKDNNLVYYDSTVGNITGIDTVTNGMITINVNFPFTSDQQVYYITDKNTLKGGSIPTTTALYNNVFNPQLQLCPTTIPSVLGTSWSTNKMVGGPTDGMYEFPDLATFTFGTDGKTLYTRNGKYITYTPPDQTDLILYEYNQIGPRLYFAGYDETSDKLIGYYGVLSSDGNTILADTHNRDARLPYYFQTIFWYGQPGITPNIHKLN